jgi:hypothetical protein
MPLKMRPTGLGHGVSKDVPDYGIFCGEWCIGRIFETRTGPKGLPWFWSFHTPSKQAKSNLKPRRNAGRGQDRVGSKLEAMELGGDGGGGMKGVHSKRGERTLQECARPLPVRDQGDHLSGECRLSVSG